MSLTRPPAQLGGIELEEVVNRVRFGGREVCIARNWKGAATLSTAYAVLRFTKAVCKGLQGEQTIVQCAYLYLPGIKSSIKVAKAVGVEYLAMPVEFGVKQLEYSDSITV